MSSAALTVANQLALAFIAYSKVLKDAADDPASYSTARTVQGESLDEAFERMFELSLQQLGLDPDTVFTPSAFEELMRGFAIGGAD